MSISSIASWEIWGRGWLHAPTPIALEPPLVYPTTSPAILDDTKHPSTFARFFARRATVPTGPDLTKEIVAKIKQAPPRPYEDRIISLPVSSSFSTLQAQAISQHLSALKHPISFEIVAEHDRLQLRYGITKQDETHLLSSLQAIASSATIYPTTPLADVLDNNSGSIYTDTYTMGFEFALSNPFTISLQAPPPRGPDRTTMIARTFSLLEAGECAIYQVLCTPALQPWHHGIAAIERATNAKLPRPKTRTQLFAVCIRVLLTTTTPERGFDLARAIMSALNTTSDDHGNTLIPLSDTNTATLKTHILSRQSNRFGMILSDIELADLIALPHDPDTLTTLWRQPRHKPPETSADSRYLGHTSDQQPLHLEATDLLKHIHIIGATGSGKSNFIISLIQQDLEAGRGIALIDPHGDLVDAVAGVVPEDRISDTIIFDPTDEDHCVGWNILEATTEVERRVISSDLTAIFERLSTSWGDQMSSVLGNAIRAILYSKQGGTLSDLRRFLIDDEYRQTFLQSVTDPYVREFWQLEWGLIASRRPQAPILTRLDAILRQPTLRQSLTLREGGLNFTTIIDTQKILLARLPRGLLGAEATTLLASMLLSKLYQTGLARQSTPASQRHPYLIYVDEFQHFISSSIASLFQELRKYGLGMVVAHQDLSQLSRTTEVASAVLGNSYTRVVFRVSERDARPISTGLAHHNLDDLTTLGLGEAIVRLGRADQDYRIQTPLITSNNGLSLKDIQAHTAALYGRPRQEVTKEVSEEELISTTKSVVSTPPASVPTDDQIIKAPERTRKENLPFDEGRGGPEHRYWQSLLRSFAQKRGYKADLEVELASGIRVDLVIIRKHERIAVEISVTTKIAHEVRQARACLQHEFDLVILISNQKRFRQQLQKALKDVDDERLQILSPEQFISLLSDSPIQTDTIAGYQVRTTVSQDATAEQSLDQLSAIIARSLARIKKG